MKYPSFKEGIGISLILIIMFSLIFFTDTQNDNEVTGNMVKDYQIEANKKQVLY